MLRGDEDANIIPTRDRVDVCRMGEGNKCCKFVTLSPKGIICLKGTQAGKELLLREHPGNRWSDNCKGIN